MIASLDRSADWNGIRAGVAGIRLAGAACARAMLDLGAEVVAIEGGVSPDHQRWAEDLREQGAEVHLGDGESLPPHLDVLVVSPGFPPSAPVIKA
ncbi:MAG: UDP-N-acetylmuramoyl-L-alanine--D-glutamate ligase, partial [Micrococcales bacterium]|nr:UDP-N-acetylmuramoyl-L-alanine--D-glutamate ligase [Micrococcales bacterium]